jgi:hypothetical protein
MDKIKAIIKRPGEPYGHVSYISNTLKNFQHIVGGYIETVPVGTDGTVIVCNEEGKILGLPRNFVMGFAPFQDIICGTVVICGTEGEEFGDIGIDMREWKRILNIWERGTISG